MQEATQEVTVQVQTGSGEGGEPPAPRSPSSVTKVQDSGGSGAKERRGECPKQGAGRVGGAPASLMERSVRDHRGSVCGASEVARGSAGVRVRPLQAPRGQATRDTKVWHRRSGCAGLALDPVRVYNI